MWGFFEIFATHFLPHLFFLDGFWNQKKNVTSLAWGRSGFLEVGPFPPKNGQKNNNETLNLHITWGGVGPGEANIQHPHLEDVGKYRFFFRQIGVAGFRGPKLMEMNSKIPVFQAPPF